MDLIETVTHQKLLEYVTLENLVPAVQGTFHFGIFSKHKRLSHTCHVITLNEIDPMTTWNCGYVPGIQLKASSINEHQVPPDKWVLELYIDYQLSVLNFKSLSKTEKAN